MTFDLSELAKLFGAGIAFLAVVAASIYTGLKVLRSDRSLDRLLGAVEEERDYWKAEAKRERTAAEAAEERLTAKLDAQMRISMDERHRLYAEIQSLREVLQTFILRQATMVSRGPKGDQGDRGERGGRGERGIAAES